MRKIINKKAFLKLVKEEKKARNEGKYLYAVNPRKAKQLSQYYKLIANEIFWKQRNKYSPILTDFLDYRIDIFQFYNKFGQLYYKSQNEYESKKQTIESNFEIHNESSGFTNLVGHIQELIDRVNPELEQSNEFEITEANFRLSLEYIVVDWLPRYCDKPANKTEPIIFKSETFFDKGLDDTNQFNTDDYAQRIDKSFTILKICLVLVGLLISSIIHI